MLQACFRKMMSEVHHTANERSAYGSFAFHAVPPEVTSAERTVHAWPGGRADLTCIVRAEPRATVCTLVHSFSVIVTTDIVTNYCDSFL